MQKKPKYGNFLITNRIENPDDIAIDHDGYKFAKGKVHQITSICTLGKTTGSRLKKIYFSKETDFLLLALCSLDCTDFLVCR